MNVRFWLVRRPAGRKVSVVPHTLTWSPKERPEERGRSCRLSRMRAWLNASRRGSCGLHAVRVCTYGFAWVGKTYVAFYGGRLEPLPGYAPGGRGVAEVLPSRGMA